MPGPNQFTRRRLLKAGTALAAPQARGGNATGAIQLVLQTRNQEGRASVVSESVDPRKVAIFAVDCWHYHWCRTWRSRAGSLIPRFNHSFDAARKLGMTLIFGPTNAMRDLNESPQRKATLALPNHPLRLDELARSLSRCYPLWNVRVWPGGGVFLQQQRQ